MDRMSAGWGTPIEWRYPIRFYPNPTCGIYNTMSSHIQILDLYQSDLSYLSYPILLYLSENKMNYTNPTCPMYPTTSAFLQDKGYPNPTGVRNGSSVLDTAR